MRFALRAAAAVFATLVALATTGGSGARVPESAGARLALAPAEAAVSCAPEGRGLAGYRAGDTLPDSAARPAEPLPGAGLKNGTEPLATRERWSLARSTPPAPAPRVRRPTFARQSAAARDGTLSARSTGLPPPA